MKICKECEINLRMAGFGVQIRPYRDGLTNIYDAGYAVVVPFSNKVDALEFTEMLSMFVAEVNDDIPMDANLGVYGEDMVKTAHDILKSSRSEDDEA